MTRSPFLFPVRPALLSAVLMLASGWVSFLFAESNAPAIATWGSMDLGIQYVGWSSSYAQPYNGSEILVPMTFSVIPWKGGKIYAQTQFTNGNYTDSASSSTETLNLTNVTDTVVGFQTDLKSFGLPSLINVGLNIPTGDPTWETKQTASIVPTEFINGDYRGRGFGLSLLYGLALPAGSEQYGIAGGYMYSGAFNPNFGQGAPDQLKLGDSFFISMNRVARHGDGQSDVIRVSAFYFLPTQERQPGDETASDLLQMGPNLNLSYGWNNPQAFSFEVGTQYFFPMNQVLGGQLTPEPKNSLGSRFYANPSYSFGDLSFAGRLKYILPNGYSPSDFLRYDGGGFTVGLEPSLRLKLDPFSALRISTSYDYVFFNNGSYDLAGDRVNVEYGHWTFGTHYEVAW